MTRAEFELCVKVVAQTLYDDRPRGPLTPEQERACWQRCRDTAERKVREFEARGLFIAESWRVA